MVHLKNQSLFIAAIVTIVLLITDCDEKIFTESVNCDECYTLKPDSVNLIIDLTLNKQYSEIPVLLYKGNIPSGEFIDTFYFSISPGNIWVKADETYSAKAIYKSDERTVFVVDGAKQKLKRVTDVCSDPCWVADGVELDLVLAY
jgi:hypothetical protein